MEKVKKNRWNEKVRIIGWKNKRREIVGVKKKTLNTKFHTCVGVVCGSILNVQCRTIHIIEVLIFKKE